MDTFSSKNEIEQHLNVDSTTRLFTLNSDTDFDWYFDIDACSKWIEKPDNGFKKIALQFPDDLLSYSIRICARLKQICKESTFFVLADTSYGSCCVDLVAAEHYNADALIHYGPSCLSQVDKLPVYYVFEKLPLDLDAVQREVDTLTKESNEHLVILYDVAYEYKATLMEQRFASNPLVYVSRLRSLNNVKISTTTDSYKEHFGRLLPTTVSDSINVSFFYIGSQESFLNPFLFYFNKHKFYRYLVDVVENTSHVETVPYSSRNRSLMKRYYLIERARDAKIFGILIGTMSVAQYAEAIEHVSALLRQNGRRYYLILVGKLNCAKLNNFMEVDLYVLVACSANSLIDSKELNKPVITVYELEIAFNAARLWGNEFVVDFRQLLHGREHYVESTTDEREGDVSLVTGGVRLSNTVRQINNANMAVVLRNEGLSVMHYEAAGEYLQNRTWSGLKQKLGETEVCKATEGRKGIAAGYTDETTPNNS